MERIPEITRIKRFIKIILTVFIGFTSISCRETDDKSPVIALKGNADTNILQYHAFKEPGYSAYDETDGDITSFVAIKGQVDESTPHVYVITYKVSDKAGNFAVKLRNVTVESQK